jgi:hypothetical protein
MRDVLVFNNLTNGWVTLDDSFNVVYVADKTQAHVFSFLHLIAARDAIEAFYLYPKNMFVVPVGSNAELYDCLSLLDYIKEEKKRMVGKGEP